MKSFCDELILCSLAWLQLRRILQHRSVQRVSNVWAGQLPVRIEVLQRLG